jgi:hypothetical protein
MCRPERFVILRDSFAQVSAQKTGANLGHRAKKSTPTNTNTIFSARSRRTLPSFS